MAQLLDITLYCTMFYGDLYFTNVHNGKRVLCAKTTRELFALAPTVDTIRFQISTHPRRGAKLIIMQPIPHVSQQTPYDSQAVGFDPPGVTCHIKRQGRWVSIAILPAIVELWQTLGAARTSFYVTITPKEE